MSRLFFLALGALGSISAHAESRPYVAGSWTELRKAPVFTSAAQPLPKPWGKVLPVGVEFQVEKTYGRWFYGTAKGKPTKGWVYSRTLLPLGDRSTLSDEQKRLILNTGHHSQILVDKLGIDPALIQHLNFLESIVLGQKVFQTFRQLQETPSAFRWPEIWPSAWAENLEKTNTALGLSGVDLNFLQEEAQTIQKQAAAKASAQLVRERKKWRITAVSPDIQARLIGRFLLAKENALPPLTHEEADTTLYFRAVTQRALDGCSAKIQNFWRLRAWQPLRSTQAESKYISGGYFLLGSDDLAMIANEADLAFVLLRPLVEMARVQEISRSVQSKNSTWWKQIPLLAAQNSTGRKAVPDASDDIEIDIATSACLGKAGYSHETGLRWLLKLIAAKKPNLEYRSNRLQTLLKEALSSGEVLAATALNERRYLQAERLWQEQRR